MDHSNGVGAPATIALPELVYYQLRAAVAECELAQHRAQQAALAQLQQAIETARQTFQAQVDAACATLVDGYASGQYRLDLEGKQLVRHAG